jgi:thiamine-monophosphate kinase
MDDSTGERAAISRLVQLLPPPPGGQTWIGDDAAVLELPESGRLLLATDCLVDGVHFDLSWSQWSDVGWKALAVNVSDIAAMGGKPLAAVVAVVGPVAADLERLYEGIGEAAGRYGCPVVGGDLSSGPGVVVTVAVLGAATDAGPVLRSGARAGDTVFVTGPLGRAAAGLRMLRSGAGTSSELLRAHRRPEARLAEGAAAAAGGASAMIDVSDGLGIDLDRLATASRVGLDLHDVPVARGATLVDALGGGEDYELAFCAPDPDRVLAGFASAGLRGPIAIGRCTGEPSLRRLDGGEMPVTGYDHDLGARARGEHR